MVTICKAGFLLGHNVASIGYLELASRMADPISVNHQIRKNRGKERA